MQQAVLERRVLHQDVVGELEHALEGAGGDAAVEHLGLVLGVFVGGFLALDRQRVFLRDDGKLALGEAGDRDADPVSVLTGAFDVVGRIAGSGIGGLVEQRKQPVEADGRTIKGGEVESTHE